MKTILSIIFAFAVLTMSAQVIRVSPTGSGTQSGVDWANAATLEQAVSIATSTNVLWVQAGTYLLDSTLVIPQGVRVYGGFAGTETQVSQRNFATNVTIIDANQQFAAVTLGQNSVLGGFTIQGGVANIPSRMDGGGVLMRSGSRLEHSHVINNVAAGRGGGIFVEGNAIVVSSVVAHNKAGISGFAVSGDQVLFQRNTVVDNTLLPCMVFDTVFLDTICTGHTLALSTSIAGTYVWSTGDTGSSITMPALTADSVFWVRITMPDFCVAVHSFDIHVLAQTLELTSAAATADQSIALGDSILHIVYTFGGVADSVSITWTGSENANLPPAGVTVSDLTVSPVTISGTPTQAGIYIFTITTIGAVCDSVELSGSINAGMRGCNLNTPGWVRDTFTDLGTITWGNIANTDIETGTTLIMGTGGRPVQVWSGHVFASACAKGNATNNNEFDGGVAGNFNADCRQTLHSFSNRGASRTGDLFSWCAVMRFENVLCPDGWRVPTTEDFAILHQNLGFALPAAGGAIAVPIATSGAYAPNNTQQGSAANTANPASIGGTWGGARFAGEVTNVVNAGTHYWSSTEVSATGARNLAFSSIQVWPERLNPKQNGFALRCVRDTILPPQLVGDMTITPDGDTICNPFTGGNVVIAPTFTHLGTSPTFQWSIVTATDTTDITSATSQSLTLTGANIPDTTTTFRITVTNNQTNLTAHFEQIITVIAQTLELTSALATANQNIALGDSILHIVYTFGGVADSVRITWTGSENANLPPAGVTVSDLTVSPVTISGTPTQAGIYLFTITTIGAVCDSVELSGSINAGMRGCNLNTPGWVRDTFTGLGTITWGNVTNTDIEAGTSLIMGTGGRPVQVWSGAVFASACAKGNNINSNEFNGGVAGNFNADCRQTLHSFSNRGASRTGDLFSWCAVIRFGDTLCPYPWRVPTRQDFIDLDRNLGGTGANNQSLAARPTAYRPVTGTTAAPQIGGIWGGARFTGHATRLTSAYSDHWSSTESSATTARYLYFGAGNVWPEGNVTKNHGFTLRCVRDYACDMLIFSVDSATANQTVGSGQIITPVTVEFATGTLGTATTTDIRWTRIDSVGVGVFDTLAVAMPTGFAYNGTTHTLSGATTASGRYIFEIFTTNHDTACDEATVRGTLTVDTVIMTGCNNNPLPFELGTPYFASSQQWQVGTQVWSDAVRAPGCAGRTTEFNGGASPNFNADCRSAVNAFQGHLFSWCMVVRFADVLCPDGWRVPTSEDFRQLHLNLGYATVPNPGGVVNHGITSNPATWTYAATIAANAPYSLWGGAWHTSHINAGTNVGSHYWSSTETSIANARNLHYNNSQLWPEFATAKSAGLALRCVRNYACDMLNFAVDSATANQTVGSGQIINNIVVELDSTTLGIATTTDIRWSRIDSVGVGVFDTITVAMPTGLTYNGTTHTLSGSTAASGRYIFEIFTTNHDAACDEATIRGTLTVDTVIMTGCNNNPLPFELGTPYFASSQQWQVGTQVWSDAVRAPGCAGRTTEFDGGASPNFNADCRSAINAFQGHLFSWCMVVRFADVLCPDGWRVPTRQDFIDLDIALGGTGLNDQGNARIAIYVGSTGTTAAPVLRGGVWGGTRWTGDFLSVTNRTHYWSSDNATATSAINFSVGINTGVRPQFSALKNRGYALRCVRDYACDMFNLTSAAGTANQSVCNGQTIVPITFELVEGTLGIATTTDIRWFSVSTDGADTTLLASAPTGFSFNPATITITGSTTVAGHYIFEIFTVDHDAACAEATVRGTINVTVLPCPGCNNNPLPFELGTPYFASSQEWQVGTQVWSDAVRAPGCDKLTFNGGTSPNFNADCRRPINYFHGHYFSWCMVMRFADVLCPGGWRVPTAQDFVDLDIALGGNGLRRNAGVPVNGVSFADQLLWYMPATGSGASAEGPGGTWGGSRFTAYTRLLSFGTSYYWSSTQASATQARYLHVGPAFIHPQFTESPGATIPLGFALRCVRNYACDMLSFTVDSATANQTVGSGQIINNIVAELDSTTLGIATTTDIRWTRIDSVGVGVFDTIAVAMPTGLTYNGTTHTLSGATTASGRYIFEIFTTNHDTACDEATIRGTLTVTTVPTTGCNSNTPGWGDTLGTITWGNTTNTNIETGRTVIFGTADRPTQVWSGALFASACAKGNATNGNAFNGGVAGNYNADCRQSFHTFTAGRADAITGDFFSWCAVVRFADELCPYPWRVPTVQDFEILHQNLGHALPAPGSSVSIIANTYIGGSGHASAPEIGGVWGGARLTGWTGELTNANSYYWASTEATTTTADRLTFSVNSVWINTRSKERGYALRCVRNYACDMLNFTVDSATANQTVGSGQIIAPVIAEIISGPLGVATTTDIRWWKIVEIGIMMQRGFEIELPVPMPTGLSYNGSTHTLSGSTATPGRYIFEIFTVDHDYPTCDTASIFGTLTVTNIPTTGCNSNTPGFGGGTTGVAAGQLGTVTWGNRSNANIESQTTVVSRSGTPPATALGYGAQIWSGAVFAQGCNKGNTTSNNEFSGGSVGNLNADCRRSFHSANNAANPEAHITGDLFSWCAVMRFADVLCPAPWRVPTADDFRHLHWILTGQTPPAAGSSVAIAANIYMGTTGTAVDPTIGGIWGGARFTGYGGQPGISRSFYRSSTEVSGPGARILNFGSTDVVLETNHSKGSGFALRCVRDTILQEVDLGITWGTTTNTDIEVGTTLIMGSDGRTDQLWSGHVFASVCAKNDFDGGFWDFNAGWVNPVYSFNADCRQSLFSVDNRSVSQTGDLFSWYFVMNFADSLCPYPWRVPTVQDFIDLDKNFDGPGDGGESPGHEPVSMRLRAYLPAGGTGSAPQIGGAWGGVRFNALPTLWNGSGYWSSSESGWLPEVHAELLLLDDHHIDPQAAQMGVSKNWGVALRCVRDTIVLQPLLSGCNDNAPGWGGSLGNITWGDVNNADIDIGVTLIQGAFGRPDQLWSGAVFATACAKGNATSRDQFDGGTNNNFNADCRQTLGSFNNRATSPTGDLFSWCAVHRFQEQLCPFPWRVPTRQDFMDLGSNLSGSSSWSWDFESYLPASGTVDDPQIGGTWGGAAFTGRASDPTITTSTYWSSTDETNAMLGTAFQLGPWALLFRAREHKADGFAVRCVRDVD